MKGGGRRGGAKSKSSRHKTAALKRIQKDILALNEFPLSNVAVAPREKNIFEWHGTVKNNDNNIIFLPPSRNDLKKFIVFYMALININNIVNIRGTKGSPYEGGVFHGVILFPDTYPLDPPTVRGSYFPPPPLNPHYLVYTRVLFSTDNDGDNLQASQSIQYYLVSRYSATPFFQVSTVQTMVPPPPPTPHPHIHRRTHNTHALHTHTRTTRNTRTHNTTQHTTTHTQHTNTTQHATRNTHNTVVLVQHSLIVQNILQEPDV